MNTIFKIKKVKVIKYMKHNYDPKYLTNMNTALGLQGVEYFVPLWNPFAIRSPLQNSVILNRTQI